MNVHPDIVNRTKWNIFTKIINILINNNGTVFGGVVRDVYLRTYNARKFYQKYGLRSNDGSNWENKNYTDCTLDPDTSERVLIPNDIDVAVNKNDLDLLISDLIINNFKIKTIFVRDAKKYIQHINVEQGDIFHYRIKVVPRISMNVLAPQEIKGFLNNYFSKNNNKEITFIQNTIGSVTLDIMVNNTKNDIDPPFGNLDFECNGLVLTKDGIRLSRFIQKLDLYDNINLPIRNIEKITNIFTNIVNKTAVPTYLFNYNIYFYRINKMLSKGYNIKYRIINKINANREEHKCILCHEEINNTKHVKLICCNARYHNDCLVKVVFNDNDIYYKIYKCIMCRRYLTLNANTEFEIFKHELNYFKNKYLLTYSNNN